MIDTYGIQKSLPLVGVPLLDRAFLNADPVIYWIRQGVNSDALLIRDTSSEDTLSVSPSFLLE